MDYKHKYLDLEKRAEKRGITVILKPPEVMHDYAGMNWIVGKMEGFGFPIKKNEIFIARDMDWKKRYETLRHELIETKIMNEGDEYWAAHQVALKKEHGKKKLSSKYILKVKKKRKSCSNSLKEMK